MSTTTQILDFYSVDICPKCNGRRVCFSFKYDRQLVDEPMGLTITCRCGYHWYERSADYEESEKEQQNDPLGMSVPRGYAGDPA